MVVAALGAGCFPEEGSGAADEAQALDEAQCKAAGGTVVQAYAGPICAMPTPDAGQACTDGAECTALCLAGTKAGTGTCSPLTPAVGCYDVLEQGQTVGVCID